MNNPSISIIIPTFNSAATLKVCLDSIVHQTVLPAEVIIVDGLSTDGTQAIVSDYSSKHNFIQINSEKDKGIYDAMNKGIQKATGEWIYFLGSDDRLYNEFVLETVFTKNTGITGWADFVYGNVLIGNSAIVYDGPFDLSRMYRQNICHQAIFYKRKLFSDLGLYELNYPAVADWKFNLKCFFNPAVKISYLSVVVAEFSGSGMSGTAKDPFYEEKHAFYFSELDKLSVVDRRKTIALLATDGKLPVAAKKSSWNLFIYLLGYFFRSLRMGKPADRN